MSKPKPFPFVPLDLLEALEAAFPNKLPSNPELPHSAFAAMVGQQNVIAFLQHKASQQGQL
jgi:hypothetical protein